MIPFFASRNISNQFPTYTKMLGNFRIAEPKSAQCNNWENIGFMKLAQPMSATNWLSSVQAFICNVIKMRIPSQVIHMVVKRVAVIMATFHSFWAWANERHQDKPMDTEALFNVSGKVNVTPFVSADERLQLFSIDNPRPTCFGVIDARHGAHMTVIGDLVKAFKTWNFFPYLHDYTSHSFINYNDAWNNVKRGNWN